MKSTVILLLVLAALTFGFIRKSANENDSLQKLSWISGNWKGMDGATPFYEIYTIANDSTLEIVSYDWNGKDSSGTSKSRITRQNGTYYLGDSLNWKVVSITDSSITMLPNYKAYNAIHWQKKHKDKWEAILESKRGTKIYTMERIDHFPGIKN